MNPHFNDFKKMILHSFKYYFFLLMKLPLAFFTGLKVTAINIDSATVCVKFKWLNQNPFRSIYFAVLAMAAELSTGLLAFGNIYKRNPTVSMLVTKMHAEFYKKAIGKISFTCNNGNEIAEAIEQAIHHHTPTQIQCESVGKNEQNEIVAKFYFEWSFKVKQ